MSVGRGHLPASFDSWDRDQQIHFIAFSHTRAGLIASVFAHADIDVRERSLDRDYRLTKSELAAIYITLEGYSA